MQVISFSLCGLSAVTNRRTPGYESGEKNKGNPSSEIIKLEHVLDGLFKNGFNPLPVLLGHAVMAGVRLIRLISATQHVHTGLSKVTVVAQRALCEN